MTTDKLSAGQRAEVLELLAAFREVSDGAIRSRVAELRDEAARREGVNANSRTVKCKHDGADCGLDRRIKRGSCDMPQVNPEPPNPIPPTPTGSNADEWCWLISECSAAYVAVQIAERIEAVERERDEMRALRDKWADAALAADKRAEAAEAREKGEG
jgi:hypothetical protein